MNVRLRKEQGHGPNFSAAESKPKSIGRKDSALQWGRLCWYQHTGWWLSAVLSDGYDIHPGKQHLDGDRAACLDLCRGGAAGGAGGPGVMAASWRRFPACQGGQSLLRCPRKPGLFNGYSVPGPLSGSTLGSDD